MEIYSLYSNFLSQQITNLLPYFNINEDILTKYEANAVKRSDSLIKRLKTRDNTKFNIKISWHLATFIYWLSREIWENEGNIDECAALFCLNKLLNSIDLFYEIDMPEAFFLGGHTSGQVFAKANYKNFLVTYQNCTIGRNLNDAPTLGKYNVLYPGSSVIGNCSLGDNVILGPGVQVVDRDIEDNTMLKLNDNHCIENYKLHKIHALRFFQI